MVGADTRKEREPNRTYEGLGEVLMWKSVDLWWEHTDITAGKGKVVSRFPRL